MIQTKQPAETLVFAYDFTSQLGGVAIGAVASIASTPRGGGANLVNINSGFDASTVRVEWQGGVDGESYLTTVRVTDAAGQVHEIDGEILVRETGFAVPTGIVTRYLSVSEYVDRFGVQETVRLTDETRSGVVDGPKIEQAIKDAIDVAEGYIGTRYDVPLADPPHIVKSIVAALTREALHKTRPTPEVAAAADRARTQLRDISAGRMTLPIETTQAEAVASGRGFAVTSGDTRTSGLARGLDEFTALGRADCYVPRWRR